MAFTLQSERLSLVFLKYLFFQRASTAPGMGLKGLAAVLVVGAASAWGIAAVHQAQTEERMVSAQHGIHVCHCLHYNARASLGA